MNIRSYAIIFLFSGKNQTVIRADSLPEFPPKTHKVRKPEPHITCFGNLSTNLMVEKFV